MASSLNLNIVKKNLAELRKELPKGAGSVDNINTDNIATTINIAVEALAAKIRYSPDTIREADYCMIIKTLGDYYLALKIANDK